MTKAQQFYGKKPFSIFLLMVILTHFSCVSPKPPLVKEVQNFQAKLKDVQPQIGFDLIIQNDNPWAVRLTNIDTDIKLENKPIGKLRLDKKIRIKSHGQTAIPVIMDITAKDLLTSLPASFISLKLGNDLDVGLTGSIKLKKFLFSKKFTFDLKQKVGF